MKKLMLTALLLTPALFAGCANTEDHARPRAADDPTELCFSQLLRDQRFEALYKKTPRVAREATLEQLASKEVPDEQGKKDLSEWVSFRLHCLKSGASFRAEFAPPGYDAVYTWIQIEIANAAALLYAGEMTYGQFSQKRLTLGSEYDTRMADVIAGAQSTAGQQNQLDPVRQQLMVDQLRKAFMPGPSIGTGTSCTTRNIGGTVYTDCR
tara:strand:+ start:185 stop:814 length:630 start_codon:yes stop_codon:yes gene_type:complete